MTVTQELAGLALSTPPDDARHAARRTLANIVGLAVGASEHPATAAARAALGDAVGEGATVLGTGERLSLTSAALLNGLAAHVEDFDDTHLATVIHPGAPIVPAALAVAERVGATYDELVDAVAVGVEITLRIGNGLGTGHFDRGWHLTSSTGRFGAAAAAGRLLKLDADEIAVALGIAATQVAGLQESLGTMVKSYHPGKAAADGVEAALLAGLGVDGPAESLDGPLGYARSTSPDPDCARMLAPADARWEIVDNAFKPYSCGIVSHPVIDAAIALRDRLGPADLASVTVRTNPVVLDVMGVEDPVDGLQSKFSAYHCFAVGLVHGAGGPAQFSDEAATDPVVRGVRGRVTVVLDPDVARDECFATALSTSGEVHETHVEHATASADRPMTDEQLVAKFVLVAGPVMGDDAAEQLARELVAGSADVDPARLAARARVRARR